MGLLLATQSRRYGTAGVMKAGGCCPLSNAAAAALRAAQIGSGRTTLLKASTISGMMSVTPFSRSNTGLPERNRIIDDAVEHVFNRPREFTQQFGAYQTTTALEGVVARHTSARAASSSAIGAPLRQVFVDGLRRDLRGFFDKDFPALLRRSSSSSSSTGAEVDAVTTGSRADGGDGRWRLVNTGFSSAPCFAGRDGFRWLESASSTSASSSKFSSSTASAADFDGMIRPRAACQNPPARSWALRLDR